MCFTTASPNSLHFTSRAPGIIQALKNGKDLTFALTQSRLFPEDFLSMIATGEEGGRVPEIMRQRNRLRQIFIQ